MGMDQQGCCMQSAPGFLRLLSWGVCMPLSGHCTSKHWQVCFVSADQPTVEFQRIPICWNQPSFQSQLGWGSQRYIARNRTDYSLLWLLSSSLDDCNDRRGEQSSWICGLWSSFCFLHWHMAYFLILQNMNLLQLNVSGHSGSSRSGWLPSQRCSLMHLLPASARCPGNPTVHPACLAHVFCWSLVELHNTKQNKAICCQASTFWLAGWTRPVLGAVAEGWGEVSAVF